MKKDITALEALKDLKDIYFCDYEDTHDRQLFNIVKADLTKLNSVKDYCKKQIEELTEQNKNEIQIVKIFRRNHKIEAFQEILKLLEDK